MVSLLRILWLPHELQIRCAGFWRGLCDSVFGTFAGITFWRARFFAGRSIFAWCGVECAVTAVLHPVALERKFQPAEASTYSQIHTFSLRVRHWVHAIVALMRSLGDPEVAAGTMAESREGVANEEGEKRKSTSNLRHSAIPTLWAHPGVYLLTEQHVILHLYFSQVWYVKVWGDDRIFGPCHWDD